MTQKRMTRRGLPNLPKARVKAPRRNEPKAKNYFSNKLLHSNVVITCLSSTRFVNFCVHVDIHILLWKIKDDVPYSKFDIENKKRITATILIDFMTAYLNLSRCGLKKKLWLLNCGDAWLY